MMARVGVDVDGVLYPIEEHFQRFMGLPVKQAQRWEFYEDLGMTRQEFEDHCNKLVNEGKLFWQGTPYPFETVSQMVRLRAAGHTIVLITNRDYGGAVACEKATRYWLHKWRIPYDELHFVKDKTTIQVDYHIDDNADNVKAMNAAGVKVFICDRPWNQHVTALSIGAYRGTLRDFVDRVLDRESKVPDSIRRTALGELADKNADMVSLGRSGEVIEQSEEVRVTSSTGGQKGTKLARFDLIPPSIWQVAELYGKGAEKYEDWNWRKGYNYSLSYAALQRHAHLFWSGEDYDAETGCHHMASVAFHALALMTFGKEHPEFDDRFKVD